MFPKPIKPSVSCIRNHLHAWCFPTLDRSYLPLPLHPIGVAVLLSRIKLSDRPSVSFPTRQSPASTAPFSVIMCANQRTKRRSKTRCASVRGRGPGGLRDPYRDCCRTRAQQNNLEAVPPPLGRTARAIRPFRELQ